MVDFNNNYKPSRNDVVYGNSSPREEYILNFIRSLWDMQPEQTKSLYDEEDDDGAPEDFLGEVYTKLEMDGIYINSYNEPISRGNFKNISNIILQDTNLPRVITYINKLNASRYSLSNLKNAKITYLAKGNISVANNKIEDLTPSQKEELYMLLAIRRGCKYGINHISALNTGARVHYILDGITMKDVVDKKTYKLFTTHTGVPISTSELRYMFRNWHDLQIRYTNERILFYKNNIVVRPPWYDSANIWIPYAEQLIAKLPGQIKSSYSKKIEAFNTNKITNPNLALNNFFSIRTARELV